MENKLINQIKNDLIGVLTKQQMEELTKVMLKHLKPIK